MHRQRFYTLSASCPDRVGIVAKVSGFFAAHQGWILETALHADDTAGRYFMRIEVKADSLPFHLAELRERFRPIAEELEMEWKITDSAVKKRVVLLVSKQEHCLYDLLARWQSKELDIECPLLRAVVESNEQQIQRGIDLVEGSGRKNIGVLGLSFKPGTDDVRESPIVPLVETLVGRGYQVRIYDSGVKVNKLVGANKLFLERQLPPICTGCVRGLS